MRGREREMENQRKDNEEKKWKVRTTVFQMMGRVTRWTDGTGEDADVGRMRVSEMWEE
jgi:hypothetical protein